MILRIPRRAALIAVATLIAAASLVSFAESYRGLYDWAAGHGLPGVWAGVWPLQVDVFIAVGELALFVALADRWAPRSRYGAWAVTLAGLAVSVAGNVGHAASHALTARVTWAIPPLAAASALAVGLGVLKRVVEAHHAAVPVVASVAPKPRQAAAARKRQKPATWRGKAAAVVAANPAVKPAELALQCRVSKRTAERYLTAERVTA